MAFKGTGRRQALLADPDVKRWNANLARGAQSTADNYLRILGRFLEMHKFSAAEFIALPAKARDDLFADHVSQLLAIGRAGSTVAVVKKAVVSWLDWHDKRLGRRIKVPGAGHRPSLRDAHIPTQDELRRVLNVCDPRARTAISLMAFSGVRPQVLGNYDGSDGLRLASLVDSTISGNELVVDACPLRILVPEHLSKTRRPYFTFLGQEGCDYLLAYLGQRIAAGEALSGHSPVITPKFVEKEFVRALNIGDLIRKPMRAAGLKEPPYIWRSYFSSRTMLAEGSGFTRDYRMFCMGHLGDIQHVYALHKQLPPDTIEVIRSGYATAVQYLETGRQEPREDPTLKMISVLLQAAGYSEEQLVELDLAKRTEEELVGLLREGPAGQRPAAGPLQRIIGLQELDQALTDGWVFRATLPDGRAVVEAAA